MGMRILPIGGKFFERVLPLFWHSDFKKIWLLFSFLKQNFNFSRRASVFSDIFRKKLKPKGFSQPNLWVFFIIENFFKTIPWRSKYSHAFRALVVNYGWNSHWASGFEPHQKLFFNWKFDSEFHEFFRNCFPNLKSSFHNHESMSTEQICVS